MRSHATATRRRRAWLAAVSTTLLLTGWALLDPAPPAPVVMPTDMPAVEPTVWPAPPPSGSRHETAPAGPGAEAGTLPVLQRPWFGPPSAVDPFAVPVAAAMEVAPPAPAPAAPAIATPAAEPARPAAPLPDVRFLGRLVRPGGQVSLFLLHGEREVEAMPGHALDEHYVVQAVDEATVLLAAPAFDTQVRVALPAADAEPR